MELYVQTFRKKLDANLEKIIAGMTRVSGLRWLQALWPRVLVSTSHPVLFSRPAVRTLDVGWNTENLPEDGSLPDSWDDLIGIDLVALVNARDNQDGLGKHPLKHDA